VSGELDRPSRNDDGSPPEVETWEGVPLELELPPGGMPPGEETIERPISELVPPALVGTPWLARWLLFGGMGGLTFSLLAIVLSLLHAGPGAPWQGALLALDGAVFILVLRSYLLAGTPADIIRHRVLSLTGLVASAFVIQAAIVRSAVRFVYGTPPPQVLTELFVFGLLGLAGAIIFAECLQGRGWACRSAAASALTFLALVLFQTFSSGGVFRRPASMILELPRSFWPTFGSVALGAASFVLAWEGLRRRGPGVGWLAVVLGSLAALAVGAAVGGRVLTAGVGAAVGSHRAWLAAALWEAAALLPLALPGVIVAWRRDSSLQEDVLEARQFLWILVALGVVAMVGVWLPTHLRVDLLRMGLVAAGVTAVVAGAWLGARQGDWAGRWALVPVGGATIAVLCTLGDLQAFTRRLSPGGSAFWPAVVMLSWCSLAVGLVFCTAGLAVKRSRARARSRGRLLWADAHLLAVVGVGVSSLLLSLLFALWAGSPTVTAALRGGLAGAGAAARDLLAIAGGTTLRDNVLRAVAAARGACAGLLAPAAAAPLLAIVLTLHLAALSRVRWAMHATAVIWSGPLAAASALAALYALRLLLPLGETAVTTPFGRAVVTSLALRLMLLGVSAVLLVRLWESLNSTLRLSRGVVETPSPSASGAGREPSPTDRHLSFLVTAGVVAGSVGLGAALLLSPGRAVEATLEQLGFITVNWWRTASVLTSEVGRLAAEWVGYAAAAAVVVIVLMAVHEEARHGRLAVYPLLAGVWTLLVGVMALDWALQVRATVPPAPAGRLAALAVTGFLITLLLAATLTVWVRWWTLRARPSGNAGDLLDERDPLGAARSLGSFGLVLVVAASVAAAHAALRSVPRFSGALADAGEAARALVDRLAYGIEHARVELDMADSLGAAVLALVVASLLVMGLHAAAGRGGERSRMLVFVVWLVGAMVGAGLGVHALLRVPFGEWGAGRVMAAVLLAAFLVRVLLAVCNIGAWARRGAEEPVH